MRIDYRDGTIPVVTTAERPIFGHASSARAPSRCGSARQDGAGNYVVAYRTVKIKAPPKKKGKGKKKQEEGAGAADTDAGDA